MINMHYYNVDQLITILRLCTRFTDFTSEGLSRDLNTHIKGGDIAPDYFKGILLKISIAIMEIGVKFENEFGFDVRQLPLILKSMFGSSNIQSIPFTPEFTSMLFNIISAFIDSNPEMGIEEFNQKLGLNSDDWSLIIKYAFRNTTLIDKKSRATERNWLTFSNKVMKLCLKEAQMNDPVDNIIDDPFSIYIKYPNISGEFKNFIGQLIKDNCIKEAHAIHLMLQYCRKIATTENGVAVDKLSPMVSDIFFKGLEIFDAYEKNIIKSSNVSQLELYMQHLKIFTPGFTYVLQDPAFSEDFSIEKYLGCSQLEMEEIEVQTKPKKEGIIGKFSQLRLSDISKNEKKHVDSKNITSDKTVVYNSNPTIISSSPRTDSDTQSHSPNTRDGLNKSTKHFRSSESPKKERKKSIESPQKIGADSSKKLKAQSPRKLSSESTTKSLSMESPRKSIIESTNISMEPPRNLSSESLNNLSMESPRQLNTEMKTKNECLNENDDQVRPLLINYSKRRSPRAQILSEDIFSEKQSTKTKNESSKEHSPKKGDRYDKFKRTF